MEESKDLIYYLRKFNRKERYFLIREAIGNGNFDLNNSFRENLQKKLNINIPKDAYAAMDYHLDWIDVSLRVWSKKIEINNKFENELNKKKKRQINSNQEDIDLIIAFKLKDIYNIILIEAKGVTGWTNKQMDSKVERLKKIFGEYCEKYKYLQVFFILISPGESDNIKYESWPKWMKKNNKPIWLELKTEKSFYKITRCRQDGKPDINGIFCKIEEK